MYSATFIFDKKQFDARFQQIDAEIAVFARDTTGYLGEEAWENMQGLQELMQHPRHLEAKAAQANWLNGYQVVIAQVISAYGDGTFPHPTNGFKSA